MDDSANRQFDITLDDWKTRFHEHYKSGIRKVVLLGGEPTLRMDVIMLAQEIFFESIVMSNGQIKIPDEFQGSIVISLDGLQETNDAIRGKAVFERAIKNYSGDPRVSLNVTLMESNYLELEGIVKLAVEHSFRYVTNNLVMLGGANTISVGADIRSKIVKEMSRVQKIYPQHFFANERILDWFREPGHSDNCIWHTNALHLNINGERMRCFTVPDCTNCGCFAGAAFSCMDMRYVLCHPFKSFMLLNAYRALAES